MRNVNALRNAAVILLLLIGAANGQLQGGCSFYSTNNNTDTVPIPTTYNVSTCDLCQSGCIAAPACYYFSWMRAPLSLYNKIIYCNALAGIPQFTPVLSKGSYGQLDLGEAQTNALFASSLTQIFRRLCDQCVSTHQTIYYKRLTPLPSVFSMYAEISSIWTSPGNVINIDFQLFSTYVDAFAGTNAWTYCDYDDLTNLTGVGFPRNCGPTVAVMNQWNSFSTSRGQKDVAFAVDASVSCVTIQGYNAYNGDHSGDDIACNPGVNFYTAANKCAANSACVAFSVDYSNNRSCIKTQSSFIISEMEESSTSTCFYVRQICPTLQGYYAYHGDHYSDDIGCMLDTTNLYTAAAVCATYSACVAFNLDFRYGHSCIKTQSSITGNPSTMCLYARQASALPQPQQFNDVDIIGTGIASVWTSSHSECVAACQANSACVYTVRSPDGPCYLKKDPLVGHDGNNLPYPGNTASFNPYQANNNGFYCVANWDVSGDDSFAAHSDQSGYDCERSCIASPACTFFITRTSSPTCTLKRYPNTAQAGHTTAADNNVVNACFYVYTSSIFG